MHEIDVQRKEGETAMDSDVMRGYTAAVDVVVG